MEASSIVRPYGRVTRSLPVRSAILVAKLLDKFFDKPIGKFVEVTYYSPSPPSLR